LLLTKHFRNTCLNYVYNLCMWRMHHQRLSKYEGGTWDFNKCERLADIISILSNYWLILYLYSPSHYDTWNASYAIIWYLRFYEPFSQNMVIIFYMPIPFTFALKNKYFTPNAHVLYSAQTIWTSLIVSADIEHYMVAIFVSNRTPSCLPRFAIFAHFLCTRGLFGSWIWQCCFV
jgi:hypothetical protein